MRKTAINIETIDGELGPCPKCGATSFSIFNDKGYGDVVMCDVCKHGEYWDMWPRIESDDFDEDFWRKALEG